jgi:hypothetical protein
VVIHNFHLKSVGAFPDEADSPLIVNPDAPLSCSVAAEPFQAVSRRSLQVLQTFGGIEHFQFSARDPLNRAKSPHRAVIEKVFGVPATEASDHALILSIPF